MRTGRGVEVMRGTWMGKSWSRGGRNQYGPVQQIDQQTDGVIRLEPGNLYRVIKRLLGDGLVAESESRLVPVLGEERRRYYRITPAGSRVLAAELRRLRSLLDSANARAVVRRRAT